MGSSSKRRQTMAKLSRERALQEKRERKQEKKELKKQLAAEAAGQGTETAADPLESEDEHDGGSPAAD